MGLFQKIFSKPEQTGPVLQAPVFQMLTAYQPQFISSPSSPYECETIRAAVNARATHISKLSVEFLGAAKPKLKTLAKNRPNSFQTWSQFLYRLSTILDMQNTAFIAPIYGEFGEVIGFYPLLPSSCEIVEYRGEQWLRYNFANGKRGAIQIKDVGTMVRMQYEDDYFGSSNKALSDTMDIIGLQKLGLQEAVKNSNSFRFSAQTSNFSKMKDMTKEAKNFNEENFQNEETSGGILLFPNTWNNIQQLNSHPVTIDTEQSKEVRERIYSYYGVNEEVVQNKTIGDAWSAFYEGAIEPFAIQFSEVMTQMLYTLREQTEGNRVIATANRLQYMSNSDKLQVSSEMADRGLMTRNEIREIWNLAPVPGGDTFIIRGEYYNLSEGGKKEDGNEE